MWKLYGMKKCLGRFGASDLKEGWKGSKLEIVDCSGTNLLDL